VGRARHPTPSPHHCHQRGISKSAAGAYAIDITDEYWHDVVRAAIAVRVDREAHLPKEPATLVADAVALASWLIDDAHRLGNG
jgi:hypothetical protein